MLSNGIDFVFAVGQLNTLAINIECDGQPFVLLTSMALHGDGCKFCHEAEVALRTIGEELACAKRGKCDRNVSARFHPYRRPILLQHFPLFR
ncbi:hypothetical protein ANCDUO_07658 [Ancylostoma duodenale]|uniref:Uncharacterized protein n=1 Tax=Ancylostoma duodenale TaxID=51022 RepID=A0A0C2CYE1_9BILA|nr:hypothetical protein ANCDUO_07658 [Ancylostoma duodenale]